VSGGRSGRHAACKCTPLAHHSVPGEKMTAISIIMMIMARNHWQTRPQTSKMDGGRRWAAGATRVEQFQEKGGGGGGQKEEHHQALVAPRGWMAGHQRGAIPISLVVGDCQLPVASGQLETRPSERKLKFTSHIWRRNKILRRLCCGALLALCWHFFCSHFCSHVWRSSDAAHLAPAAGQCARLNASGPMRAAQCERPNASGQRATLRHSAHS